MSEVLFEIVSFDDTPLPGETLEGMKTRLPNYNTQIISFTANTTSNTAPTSSGGSVNG